MTLVNTPRAVLTRVSSGERIELTKEATAGRLVGSDVLLNEGQASRNHARFTFDENSIWLEDLGSSNGTFVNGARISGRVRVAAGDRLRFYLEEFDVSLPESATAATLFFEAAPTAAPVAPAQVSAPQALEPTIRVAPEVVAAPAPAAPAAPAAAPFDAGITESRGPQKRPGSWTDSGAMRAAAKGTLFIAVDVIKKAFGSAERAFAAPDMDAPHLQILSGNRRSSNVVLRAGAGGVAEWSVGSDALRDVVLPDDGVSSLHARIMSDGKHWKVVDQMSSNGTFVNDKRSSMSYLSAGDRVRFGPVQCVFQMPKGGVRAGGAGKLRRVGWAVAFAVAVALAMLLWVFL